MAEATFTDARLTGNKNALSSIWGRRCDMLINHTYEYILPRISPSNAGKNIKKVMADQVLCFWEAWNNYERECFQRKLFAERIEALEDRRENISYQIMSL